MQSAVKKERPYLGYTKHETGSLYVSVKSADIIITKQDGYNTHRSPKTNKSTENNFLSACTAQLTIPQTYQSQN